MKLYKGTNLVRFNNKNIHLTTVHTDDMNDFLEVITAIPAFKDDNIVEFVSAIKNTQGLLFSDVLTLGAFINGCVIATNNNTRVAIETLMGIDFPIIVSTFDDYKSIFVQQSDVIKFAKFFSCKFV